MKPQEATDVSGCTAAQPTPPSVTAESSPPTKTALSFSAVGASRHRKAPLYSFSAASLRNPHRFCARLKLAVSLAGAERGKGEEEEEKVVVAEEPAEPLPAPPQHRWYWRCASLPASTSPASAGAEGREGDGASGGRLHQQPPTHDSASREMGRPPSAEGEAMMEVLRDVQQQLRSLQESLARLQAEQQHSTTATAPPPPPSSSSAFTPSSSAAQTGGGGGGGGAASVEVSEVPTPHPCDSTAVAAASATGSVPHTPDDDGTAVDRTPRPPTERVRERGGLTPSSDTPLSPDPVVPTPVALPVPVSVLPPAAAAAAGWGEAANAAPLSPSALCSASSPSSALAASAGGRQEAGGSVVASTTTPILRAVYTALGAMAETSNPASRCSSASATPQLAYQRRPPQQQQHQLGHLSRRKSWVEAVEAAGRHVFVEGDGGRPVTSLKHRVVMVSSPAQTPLQTHPLGERETPDMREREEEEGEEEGTVALVSTSRGTAAHEAAPARSPVYGMLDVYLWHHHRQPLTDPHTGGRIGSAASAGAEADASLLMASATSALRRSLATTVTVYAVPGEDRGVALTSPPSTVPVDGRAVEEAAALTAGERRTEERGGEGSGVLAASSIASGGEGAEGKNVASASVGKAAAAAATAAGAAAKEIEEQEQKMQAGEAAAAPAATTAAPSSSFSFVATTEAETPPPEQETVTRTECLPPLILSAVQPVDRHGGAGGSRSDTEAEETAAPSLTGDEDHVRAADGWGAERPSTAYAGSRTRAARLPHPPPRAQAAEQATNAAFCPLGSDSSNRRSSNADTAVTAEVVELARAALQDALRHGSMPSLTVDAPVFAPAEATRPRRPRRRVSCDPAEVPEVQSSSVTVETDGDDDDDTAAAATCAGVGVKEGPEDSVGTGGQQDSPEPLNEEPSPLLLQEVAAYHVLASAAAAEATQVVGAATQSAAHRPASAAAATAAADGPLPLPTIASCAARRGEVREETAAESGGRVAAPLLPGNRGSVSGNAARSTYSDTAELSAPAGLSATKRGSEPVSKTEGETSRATRLGDGNEKAHQGDGGDRAGSEGQVLSPPPLPPPHLHGLRAASHGAVDDSSGHRRSLDISWSVASMSSNGFKMPRPGAPSPAATPHCYSSAASSPQRRPSQAAPSPLRSVVGAGASRSASITTSATEMETAAVRHGSAAPAVPLRQHPLLHAAASATPTSSPPSPLPVESKVTDAARPTTAAGSTVLPALFQGRHVAAGAVADGCSARGCSTVPTVAADSSSYTAKDVQRFCYGGPAAASMPPVRSGGTSVLTTGQYRVEAGTRRDDERGGSAGVKVGAVVPARDGFRQRPHSAFGAVPGLLRSPRDSQNRST